MVPIVPRLIHAMHLPVLYMEFVVSRHTLSAVGCKLPGQEWPTNGCTVDTGEEGAQNQSKGEREIICGQQYRIRLAQGFSQNIVTQSKGYWFHSLDARNKARFVPKPPIS